MTTIFDPDIGKNSRWKMGCTSPNPGGRPKTRLLSSALSAKLAERKADDPEGRTYAEVIASNLIEIASSLGRGAIPAASEILDRVEGKPRQQVDFNDISADIRSRSTDDLVYHLAHGFWPEEMALSTDVLEPEDAEPNPERLSVLR